MFASLEHGEYLDSSVMVLGYVIMRVALVFQWLRAARQDPSHRRACLTCAVAVPVAVFLSLIYALYYYLVRRFDPFHVWLLTVTAAVVALAVIAAVSGLSMTVCLVIVMLAPVVTVVGYEVRGYWHQAASLAN